MKLQIFSDLHHDHTPGWVPALVEGADVVVCAGDVCQGLPEAFVYLRRSIPKPTPIVTVAGNHSYYQRGYLDAWLPAQNAMTDLDVTLLENTVAVISDVRFVGCTLWTDYRLYGDDTRAMAMDTARRGLNDHRLIAWQKKPWMRFRPEEAAILHRQSRIFLDAILGEPFDGPTIVVTHHAPSIRSIHEQYAGQLINAAYASDLEALILEYQPALWIHGHMHSSFDYHIGETRVVCNPHGYGSENPSFDPKLIVEV